MRKPLKISKNLESPNIKTIEEKIRFLKNKIDQGPLYFFLKDHN